MVWCKRNCPYKNAKGCCRMAGMVAGLLPVPVTPADCEQCLSQAEPIPGKPNAAVATLAIHAIRKQQPRRLGTMLPKLRKHIPATQPLTGYDESDFPCLHRGTITGTHECKPCQGQRTVNVYECNHPEIGGCCTVVAAGAMDGRKPCAVCLACDKRSEPPSVPQDATEG